MALEEMPEALNDLWLEIKLIIYTVFKVEEQDIGVR